MDGDDMLGAENDHSPPHSPVYSTEHDMLGAEHDNSPPGSPICSSGLVISPPRSRKRTHARRKSGEKIVIQLDNYNRPVSPHEDVLDLSSHAGKYARREIPLIYGDFREVPSGHYKRIIKLLNEHFVFENREEDGVDCPYVRAKVNNAWKSFKSMLKRTRIDGKDPALVKLEKAPKGHPVEDWRKFIDNCNTEKMKIAAAQNSENRAGCEQPNCSGRTPTQCVRRELAKEMGVPDSEVGLGRVYREMHTKKKDKALQNPEDYDGEDLNMEDGEGFGRGRLNAIGAGVSKTLFKKMAPILKRRENEQEKSQIWKNKMEGRVDGLENLVSQFVKSDDAKRSKNLHDGLSMHSGHRYDQAASVKKSAPLSGYHRGGRDGDLSQKPISERTAIPSAAEFFDGSSSEKSIQKTSMLHSGHHYDPGASVKKSVPLNGYHCDGDSSQKPISERTTIPSTAEFFNGSSSVKSTKKTSMSLNRDNYESNTSVKIPKMSMPHSGHHYDLGPSMKMSVPLSGYHRDGDLSQKPISERTTIPSTAEFFDGSSSVKSAKKTSTSLSRDKYESNTSVKKSVPVGGYHRDGNSSQKIIIERTSIPSTAEFFDGLSSVKSTQKASMPHSRHSYDLGASVKTPKTTMLLSGHQADSGSFSAKDSTQIPPMASKEHHYKVDASMVNNSKRAMIPNGQLAQFLTNSKALPKIVKGDARNLIGAKVKVRGGWPSKNLALGAIKAVDPREEFEGRKLGLGNFLVHVDSVFFPSFQLPAPSGKNTTLGQVVGSHVIWPRDDIKLISTP